MRIVPAVLLISILALGCSGARPAAVAHPADVDSTHARPAPVARPAAAVISGTIGEPVRSCRRLEGEGLETFTFDAHGLPVSRFSESDAAGTQYEERYARDGRGRVVRVHRRELEGAGGEGALEDVTVRYTEDPARRVVEARFVAPDEDERVVRWTYDERGYPSRRVERLGASRPRVVDCRFDAHGHVMAMGEASFTYAGDQVSSRRDDNESLALLHFEGVLALPSFDHPFELLSDAIEWRGDCQDVFFEACSPAFAPPPPGAERRSLPRPSAPRSWPTPLEVAQHELSCVPLPFDDGQPRSEEEELRNRAESCEARVIVDAHTPSRGRVRGAVVLELSRGDQFEKSYFVITQTEAGFRLGPQISDGPFVGNQMVGTLNVQLSDAALRQLIPGGEPELSIRYELSTARSDDGGDVSTDERGFVICRDLATPDTRCVRVRDFVREESDEGTMETSAQLRFADDGSFEVRTHQGDDLRVPEEGGAIEWLFDP